MATFDNKRLLANEEGTNELSASVDELGYIILISETIVLFSTRITSRISRLTECQ